MSMFFTVLGIAFVWILFGIVGIVVNEIFDYGFKPVDKRYSQLPAFATVLGPVLLIAVLIERVSVDLTFTHMIEYIRLFIGKLLGYKND